MIPTLGHAAVVVGLAATLFAAGAFVAGARRADPALVLLGRRAMYAAFALALLASLAMVTSLLTHDFSVRYVARNNATTTPPFYSVISLWAALEGSILFWTLLATGWAALVLHRFRGRLPALMPWPSGPASGRPSLTCSLSPATRISKNSSRLEETMVMKRSRSSSGTASSAACDSTRRWNARMPSSRLRNCVGGAILRFIEPGNSTCRILQQFAP